MSSETYILDSPLRRQKRVMSGTDPQHNTFLATLHVISPTLYVLLGAVQNVRLGRHHLPGKSDNDEVMMVHTP